MNVTTYEQERRRKGKPFALLRTRDSHTFRHTKCAKPQIEFRYQIQLGELFSQRALQHACWEGLYCT